jgi:serine protease Do
MSWTVIFTLLLSIVVLTSARCSRQAGLQSEGGGRAFVQVAASGAVPLVSLPSFAELVKREGPAVVNISTTRKVSVGPFAFPGLQGMQPDDPFFEFFRRFSPGDQSQREYQTQSLGSGFIISHDGYILTNAHVVADADDVIVRLTDKREFKTKVVGIDQRSDIALLKIAASHLPVVSIGDSSKVDVGEWVVAIGSPFGFTNSVSQGIVSAKERSLPGGDVVPFIQTDVPINPGNSGGPLFNLSGEVIGINSQIYSRSGGYMGLSFAIPIDVAMKVKEDLLKHGSVKRGWLGVSIQDVGAEHAQSFSLPKPAGVLVASVENGTPAERAGLQIGDIILRFNGKELSSAGELVRAVSDAVPGSKAKLDVWRDKSSIEIVVSLGDASAVSQPKIAQVKQGEVDKLGMTVRKLNLDEMKMLNSTASVVVEAVSGIAAKSGVQVGDLILAVNSKRVMSTHHLYMLLEKAGSNAALLVQRGGGVLFVPLLFN